MNPVMISILGFITKVKAEFSSEKGATAVEYGLLVALIAAVIIAIVATLGGQLNSTFTTMSNAL
jgi:pilus assembly protein Flp/PilA